MIAGESNWKQLIEKEELKILVFKFIICSLINVTDKTIENETKF